MEQIATNGKEVVSFKTKDSAIVATPLTPLKRLVRKWYEKNWIKRICLRILALNPLMRVTKALQILQDFFITKCKIK